MKPSTRNGTATAFAVLAVVALTNVLHAQVNVTTSHDDNSRTGQFTQETVLTPANVNSGHFGKVFSTAVDGWVYAQPLYLSTVSISGGIHNVLYVATEHDSLYAIDADDGTIYWQASLIPPGGTTINSSGDLQCADIVPEVGITGTPVIDRTTGTIYLVAVSKIGGSFYQYLHAIDIATGAEKFAGPKLIQASVPGTATDSVGGYVSFNAKMENQRAGLLLDNGHVVIGWSAHCDYIPWHGWVMSYAANTLAQEAAYNTSPDGYADGVWLGGDGLAADASGNIFIATGNGSWNGTTNLGDSIIKLGMPSGGTFPVLDYFTPYNENYLALNDLDIASGGIVLLPTLPNGRQLLAQMSKAGTIYLLDRNNLGKYCVDLTPACTTSDPQIVQEIPGATVGVWGAPAYWNGTLYWGAASDMTRAQDHIKAYSFNANGSGLLSTTPTSQSTAVFGFSAPSPSISANGTTNGILWGLDNSAYSYACSGGLNCQILYAYDATNLGTMLYNSGQAPNLRDVPGGAVKFTAPIIANGKVYVGSQYAISAFGLLNPTAAPSFASPPPGTYASAESVTLADGTSGAVIYYTTDGSTPTTASAMYGTPIAVSATTTIEALAIAPGYSSSAVTSGTYTISASSTTTGVNIAAAANIDGIGINGVAPFGGGLDGSGDTYSGTLLGGSATWSGVTFNLAGAGTLDALSGTTIALPAGNYSTLYLLGTGVGGNQLSQKFVVTYTDGTTSTVTQSLSDWYTPQGFAGEAEALVEPYRLTSSGAIDNRTFYVYGYSFAIDATKTVKSLTLPATRNVVVLAVDLGP